MKTWHIRLDMQKQYDNEIIEMVRQDTYSNTLMIHLVNNGVGVKFDDVVMVGIIFDKSDGTQVIGSCEVIRDGLLKYVVDYQAITALGITTITLKLLDGNMIETSASFVINVIADPFFGADGSIESTSEYPILTDLINKTIAAEVAEQARKLVEEARVQAELNREENEEDRIFNENIRLSNEEDRVLAEDGRISKEEDRVLAEEDRISNEQERLSNEEGRVLAELEREATKLDFGDRIVDIEGEIEEARSGYTSLDSRLNQMMYQFNTVNEMKEDLALKVGDRCITFGEEEIADDSTKVYKVVMEQDIPVDAEARYELDNGLFAYLLTIFSGIGGGGGPGTGNIVLTALTPLNMVVAEGTEAVLEYRYRAFQGASATAKYYVDGTLKYTERITAGVISIDVMQYLKAGNNTIDVNVTDINGNTANLTFLINAIRLSITSTFNQDNVYSGDITFNHRAIGQVEKVVHFIIDNQEVYSPVIVSSGVEHTQIIEALPHGEHNIKVYMTADMLGVTLTSNILEYNIITTEVGNNTIIVSSDFKLEEATKGEIINIGYKIYNPQSPNTEITLKVNGDVINTITVDRSKQYWNIINYDLGINTFEIVAGGTTRSFSVYVEDLDIDVSPVTENLSLYLSPIGRSNGESNRDKWIYKSIEATLTGFNYINNGWVTTEEGEGVLRLTGDARLTIPYKLFSTDLTNTGFTLEIEFTTHNVLDIDSTLINCLNNNIGIRISPQLAVLSTELLNENAGKAIRTRFKEDERIRISFVIEPKTSNRLIYIYINGIISGISQYSNIDNFIQQHPVDIEIGSSTSGMDIHTIRKYDVMLDPNQILGNYISDVTNTTKKLDMYRRNNIFDEYSNISYTAMLNLVPCMTIIGPLPSYKGDKRKVVVNYRNLEDPTRDIDEMLDVGIDVQGTSSQYYPRKNYKLKFPTKYHLKADSIPEKEFTVKADYMESSHSHNTGNAKIANDLMFKVSKVPPQLTNPNIRTTIDGHIIVIFHQEDENSPRICMGAYNFNNDKGNADVLGLVGTAESWELADNSALRCSFKTWDDPTRPVSSDFESRYPDDYTNYTNLQRVVEWTASTQGNVTKFRNELESYWNKDSLLAYYVIAMTIGGIDSMAKNLFINTWDGNIWYPVFYDVDTSYGLNNEGVLTFGYGIEYKDTDGTKYIFNGNDSVLWTNLELAFEEEIASMYRNLRNQGLDYDSILSVLVGQQIDLIPEALYNYDAQFKYIDPLLYDNDGTYLYIAQGSREDHLKWWLQNRLNYLDSKYNAGAYPSDYLTMRLYKPTGTLPIVPDGTFNVVCFADQYVNIKFGSVVVGERTKKGIPATIIPPSTDFNDTETIIYGASKLSSIGSLANKYIGTLDVSRATKLRELLIGSGVSGYINTNLESLSIGNNDLLEKIDIRNCVNLSEPLDLSGCHNMQEIYAQGSSITTVLLADGGNVKRIHLPSTISNLTLRNQRAITHFSMDGYSNLATLRIENLGSANVDLLNILNQAINLFRIRLIGINLTTADGDLLNRLADCSGLDENNNFTLNPVITGNWHVNSISQSLLDKAAILFPNLNITYSFIIPEFTVTFVNWDNSILDMQLVPFNTNAVDPIIRTNDPIPIPIREADPQYTYVYDGWDRGFNNIQENIIVKATYLSTIREYTVNFWNGELLLESKLLNYGDTITYTGAEPERVGYIYIGWDKSTVTGNMDVYANFIEIPAGYEWATENEFNKVGSNFRYIGIKEYVIVPKKIGTTDLVSYNSMFRDTGVKGVISINENINHMSSMFYNSKATTLDLSLFDTSNVTAMSDMFRDSSATTLDLSSFDTSKVINMSSMFRRSKATTLDLSNFDTSNVTDMSDMFRGSSATTGYARTQADADAFNASSNKPAGLIFVVKEV